jgi:hypothetical protein
MRSLIVTTLLLVVLGLLGWCALSKNARGASGLPPFSSNHTDRAVVMIDEEWAAAKIRAIADGIEAPPTAAVAASQSADADSSARNPSAWWADMPRTGAEIYRSFVLNPASVEAIQLVRNVVLNPLDLELPRDVVNACAAYFEQQCRRIADARSLLEEGRMRLVTTLIAQGQIAPVSIDVMRGRSFKVDDSTTMTGDALIEAARSSLGADPSDDSVAMTALSMAGLFGSGDTFTFAGERSYLLPFERVEEGIPTILALERSVTLEIVTEIHMWFAALGALPNADELLGKVAPKIMEGPR